MADLTGKIAVVTGGASGIGAATVRRLAEEGARVVVGYHSDAAAAERLLGELKGEGHIAIRLKIDSAGSLDDARDVIAQTHSRIDVLVNSAGSTTPVPANDLDALTDEIFDAVTRVNLRGPFATVRAFRSLLDASDAAVIINIGSIAARTGVGSNLSYCAAKAGLESLTVGLAKVLGPKIRVLNVAPAGVDTDFVKGRDPAQLQRMAESTPLRHVTSAGDVAEAVLACVRLTSSTGITIPVDEGRHL